MTSEAEGPPRTTPEPAAPGGVPACVGRASELHVLEAALEKAIAGAGGIVFVLGEPGIGKTALAGEFLRRARERQAPTLTLCRGRCTEQYGAGEAYLPFLDGMGSLLVGRGAERTRELLRTYAPIWCLQLPAAFPDAEALQRQTVGANKERMLREMADALEAGSRDFPVVLLLEDLQWADPSTVDLLRYLGGRVPRQRMLIVVTLRDADLERTNAAMHRGLLDLRPQAQEIRLGPLKAKDIGAYLDATLAPHRFPDDLKLLLERRTEGHPLFLHSLVQFLRERGDLVWDGTAFALSRPLSEADVPAPENVRGMIRRNLDALAEPDRGALQQASVLGRDFLSAVLAALMETDEISLQDQLSRVARVHRLISPQGEEELPDGALAVRYRFTHSLYQETLFEDLVPARRQLLHRRAALALLKTLGERASRHAAALALHFERGGAFPPAIDQRIRAALGASARHAYAEAIDHCDRGVGLLERVDEPERTRYSLRLHEQRGAAHHAQARFDLAIRDYSLMRERARAAGAPDRECDALTGLASALFFARRPDEMAVRAHEALVAAAQAGSRAHLAAARLQVALLLQDTGDLGSAEALLQPLVEEARSLGLRPVLMGALLQRGTLHYWRSEYALAEGCLLEALALATETGDASTTLVALMFTGNAQISLGRIGKGRLHLEEGIALSRRNGDSFWLARLMSQLGWLHRELQDFERAREHDREAVRIAREAGARWAPEPDALLSLFLDDARSGQASKAGEEARALFDRTSSERTLVGWFFDIRKESALAEHYLGQGDVGLAREHATRLLAAASDKGTPTYGITAHKLLADVALAEGRMQDATASALTALDLLRVHPCPLIAWRTFATLGRLHRRQGSSEDARAAFGESAAIANAIAETVPEEALRHSFLASKAVREVMAGARGEAQPLLSH